MERFMEVQDVISKFERLTTDGQTYYEHVRNGTIEEYYNILLTELITDMTILPLERGWAGMEAIDDSSEVHRAFRTMIEMVAVLFDKEGESVEEDLIRLMHDYPTEDVRLAQLLRHKNLLH